jgi:uncharacterized MAPEG superfamily protein
VTTPLLLVLAVFVVQTLIAPSLRYLNAPEGVLRSLRVALGPRDHQPPLPVLGERAARALANMHEALPVFISLALLHITRGTDTGPALSAAWVFLAARVLYVPAYLIGTPGVRSAVWTVGFASLVCMALSLLR